MQSLGQAVRQPVFAGTFYPASPGELRNAVSSFLSSERAHSSRSDTPKAIIAPHAGYVYSGPIAGSAFAALAKSPDIRRVVLIGPSHRVFLRGLALPAVSALSTPLGDIQIDAAAARDLLDHHPAVVDEHAAHAREHALEVELPFIQLVAPNATIVPLVVGEASPAEVADVLDRLWGGDETRIVISSDLSHYHPIDEARKLDRATASSIERLELVDPEQACGARAIDGLIEAARRRAMTVSTLDLRTSGDTMAERRAGRDEVVGYGAFAFYERAVS